ncbi:conserved hypothetical protein [Ricinus communis]|uniref:Uncharacterized protein n=1 Tax=Ricinus communis TaxID=3988 RepID=B9R750_RICCO|nr:conserved hypothetical protein [Ricinus communis]
MDPTFKQQPLTNKTLVYKYAYLTSIAKAITTNPLTIKLAFCLRIIIFKTQVPDTYILLDMAMVTEGCSTATSMKRIFSVFALFILVLSTQMISVVHCRALRSTTTTVIADNCQQENGAESASGVASFSVSSNNASTASSVRSLMYQLASGPSKKGPGH